jgi:transposase InsO family protein
MGGMMIDMNEDKLSTLAQLRAFLAGTECVQFHPLISGEDCYTHVGKVLRRFVYQRLGRGDKGVVLRYLERTTGYSRQQITRLVQRYQSGAPMLKHYHAPEHGFVRTYVEQDIALLAHTDTLHDTLSGLATKHLLRRALAQGDLRYQRLANISVAHLYNLRGSKRYQDQRVQWHHTSSRKSITIGIRRAPRPDGQPGYIRIDSVHQGDQDGVKGVYHINAVDCVTQWELVACCERISEAYLLPVIEMLLASFPFEIKGFHSDNGSEYINGRVAKVLEKLRIEMTKSRPRHSNDNGLAETKNGAVVRKMFGYSHIPQRFAGKINTFYIEFVNPYLNFHRPCMFAEEQVDAKGKIVKRYRQKDVMTPLEKFASLPNAGAYLKPDTTLALLQKLASAQSDNEAAASWQQARMALFQLIQTRSKHIAA